MIETIRTLINIAGHPLNRNAPITALLRFARWQVASRLISRPVVLPFVNNTCLVTETGMRGATGNYYCGLFEPAEMSFVLHALRPDDLFLDVGANVGVFTILASGGVGARAIAIEPVMETFGKLERNLAFNRLESRVIAHNCGASAEPGILRFTEGLDAMNRVALEGEASASVPVRTLDEICIEEVPTIVKIDVEGHEVEVLQGAQRLLAAPSLKAVLLETNGSGEKFGQSDASIFNIMEVAGFVPVSYDPEARKLGASDRSANNAIFVRNHSEMQERCSAAPRYTIVNGTI